MNRVKIRRAFPRNKFYVGVLLDWKESVDDRNFRSTLCRALINLRAYPLDISTFTDLKNIRGIGDQIARKLEEAWNVFCSQNLAVPSLKQICQMKKGEFLQFLNRSNFSEKKSGTSRTVQLPVDNLKLVKSRIVKRSARHLLNKTMLERESTISSSATVNEPYRGDVRVIRRPGALNVEIANSVADGIRLTSSITDDNNVEQNSCGSQECDDSIIYYPSAFSTVQIILIIDNRESANAKKFQQMCHMLNKKRIVFEMRSLSVGDYLWIMRMSNNTEMVLDTIVERKTVDDLWSSIVQKRYEEQKQRLASAGIANIVYILEGLVVSGVTLEQALVTTYIENRFLVYRTSDVEHTSLVLSKITERLVRKATSQECTGMSFEKFQKTSKKTRCRNVKDVFLRQLVVCPQISIRKASVIADRFPCFAALKAFYTLLPQEQLATALYENFLGVTKSASTHMAKFYSEV